MRYVREQYGDELSVEELNADLNVTIKELENQLGQAKDFKKRLAAGQITRDDGYLSFSIASEEGYDRTGPTYVVAEDDEQGVVDE